LQHIARNWTHFSFVAGQALLVPQAGERGLRRWWRGDSGVVPVDGPTPAHAPACHAAGSGEYDWAGDRDGGWVRGVTRGYPDMFTHGAGA
jgi:hypothetical protein